MPVLILALVFLCYFIWANRSKTDELLEYKKEALKNQEIAIRKAISKVDSSFACSQRKIDSIAKFTTTLNKSILIIKAKTNAKVLKINSASHNELLRDLDSLRAANNKIR